MARLFADEDFPLETVRALRRLGHDVLTTRGLGWLTAARQIPISSTPQLLLIERF